MNSVNEWVKFCFFAIAKLERIFFFWCHWKCAQNLETTFGLDLTIVCSFCSGCGSGVYSEALGREARRTPGELSNVEAGKLPDPSWQLQSVMMTASYGCTTVFKAVRSLLLSTVGNLDFWHISALELQVPLEKLLSPKASWRTISGPRWLWVTSAQKDSAKHPMTPQGIIGSCRQSQWISQKQSAEFLLLACSPVLCCDPSPVSCADCFSLYCPLSVSLSHALSVLPFPLDMLLPSTEILVCNILTCLKFQQLCTKQPWNITQAPKHIKEGSPKIDQAQTTSQLEDWVQP